MEKTQNVEKEILQLLALVSEDTLVTPMLLVGQNVLLILNARQTRHAEITSVLTPVQDYVASMPLAESLTTLPLALAMPDTEETLLDHANSFLQVS